MTMGSREPAGVMRRIRKPSRKIRLLKKRRFARAASVELTVTEETTEAAGDSGKRASAASFRSAPAIVL